MKHILAILPNWVGDVAMCTPALRALHRRFPEAELTVVGRGSGCALVNGLPYIAHRIAVPARPGLAELVRVGRSARPYARDAAVVFPHSFRAALLAWLTGAGRRIGYRRGGRSLLLTEAVEPHRENGRIEPIYMSEEYLGLVAALGAEDDGQGLELVADPEATGQVRARLPGAGPVVGFAPGAAFGPSKRWPAERFAAVADALSEQAGARCVLLVGPGEEDTRDAVLAAARTAFIRCDGGTPTIDMLKATIAQLDLLICNDSGARHVAVAFGVATVCILGSTSPRYSEGPYERGEVLRVEVDCGPCQKPVCETDHRCMTRVSSEWVTERALHWLKG
ncbi:MAG: lipopolysaccharide heptosyltransferase II [Candidatus Hydrogenedentes bacterium]|nr:lipopolysaccharide heptosyltransferase II [Candidatus Hydrogenedentota bacterium]